MIFLCSELKIVSLLAWQIGWAWRYCCFYEEGTKIKKIQDLIAVGNCFASILFCFIVLLELQGCQNLLLFFFMFCILLGLDTITTVYILNNTQYWIQKFIARTVDAIFSSIICHVLISYSSCIVSGMGKNVYFNIRYVYICLLILPLIQLKHWTYASVVPLNVSIGWDT